MRKLFAVTVFTLAVSACGGANKEAKLTQLCLKDDGGSQEACECMAKAAVEKLDGKMVDALIAAAATGDDTDAAMTELMSDMTPDQMGQFMAFGMEISNSCGLN